MEFEPGNIACITNRISGDVPLLKYKPRQDDGADPWQSSTNYREITWVRTDEVVVVVAREGDMVMVFTTRGVIGWLDVRILVHERSAGIATVDV